MRNPRVAVWVSFVLLAHGIASATSPTTRTGTNAPSDNWRGEFATVETSSSGDDDNEKEGASIQQPLQSHSPQPRAPQLPVHLPIHTHFLIGVKTAVFEGFAARQLIRETWADPLRLPHGVHVVFLGCEQPQWEASSPSPSNTSEHEIHRQSQVALQREKATYQDLLTTELQCVDSYFSLVDKVKGFFRWTAGVASSIPDLAYVMLADDDVYIRVHALLKSLKTQPNPSLFYAGEVLTTQFRSQIGVDRDPLDKNAVPHAQYPMRHKPPFATGAHYLLSLDLVLFLARNDRFLKSVGTLEDVSVAYWLMALRQVRPLHLPQFDNVRYTLCHNELLAYGDLSAHAMRQMDDNLRQNRSLCDGFSFRQWDKRRGFDPKLPAIASATSSSPFRESISHAELQHHWDLQFDTTTRVLHIQTTTTETINRSETINTTVSLAFAPSHVGFAHFCETLFRRIDASMAVETVAAIPREFCYAYHKHLTQLLREAMEESRSTSHVYALPQSNLRHGSNSAAIFVKLTRAMIRWRSLVECLVAALFSDAFVVVRDEDDYAAYLSDYPPDLVVADVADFLPSPDASLVSARFPPMARVVAFSTRDPAGYASPSLTTSFGHRVVLVSAHRHSQQHPNQLRLYLPLVSSTFVDRRTHSPRALLKPALRSNRIEKGRNAIVGFCGDCIGSSAAARTLLDALQGLSVRTIAPPCHEPPSEPHYNAFHLDTHVRCCQQIQFAVVVEDSDLVDTPGHISDRIVSAFLAGSIPIYYGHSATAAWLFNRNAFIDCRAFGSMAKCAAHVAHVHSSVDLYEAMRREPPVVNHTAFREVFSWHPDAQSANGASPISERLKKLLLSV